MLVRVALVQHEAAAGPWFGRQPGMQKRLPKIGIEKHMPDWNVFGSIDSPMLAGGSAESFHMVCIQWLTACRDSSSVTWEKNRSVEASPAELINQVPRLAPVGINHDPAEWHLSARCTLPLLSGQVVNQVF